MEETTSMRAIGSFERVLRAQPMAERERAVRRRLVEAPLTASTARTTVGNTSKVRVFPRSTGATLAIALHPVLLALSTSTSADAAAADHLTYFCSAGTETLLA